MRRGRPARQSLSLAYAATLIQDALRRPDPQRSSSLTRRLDPHTGRVLALLPVSGGPRRPRGPDAP